MASERENIAAFTRLNAYFGQMYKSAEPGPWAGLAENINSQDLIEQYSFPGGVPRLQRHTGGAGGSGETTRTDINLYSHQLANSKFSRAVPIDEIFIVTGKLGTLLPSVAELASAAAHWLSDLVQEQLLQYAAFRGYDGQPLFSASHKDGRKSQSNIVTGSGVTPANLSRDMAAVQVAKGGFTDDRGQIVGDAQWDTVVIPGTAELIESWRVIAGGDQATGQADWSGQVKRVLQLPGWTGNSWIALDTRPGIKALLTQTLQAPTTDWSQDPEGVLGDMLFSVKAFGEAGVGNWRRAILVQNS